MIYGIGTDIIEVARVEDKIRRVKGFRETIFSTAEITYCEQQAAPYQSYAARFAAKEAFLKALGTGWGHGNLHFNEVEIVNDKYGKPILHLVGDAADKLASLQIKCIHASLSHIKDTAMAMVIVEV
ncbi:holo-ACP synthase [Chitinophaga pendula]|uniref:holo-ACP synthase n=1 Tax=Chitinophaga TaxID=79328 RepID=UPI000BB03F2C|nr:MULTISPECIES: holo-ACP synthase [Chitinophaga]ASZ11475.1 holo-[acyl-carrier-protein] synthase [Chitinophaga sp. MD30]UCJ05515.1 holo-ACP synthase [Chitinophaga pendula]